MRVKLKDIYLFIVKRYVMQIIRFFIQFVQLRDSCGCVG